jgi:hypothetical protein
MTHHPQVHGIVPGDGLSLDGQRWVNCRSGFFLSFRLHDLKHTFGRRLRAAGVSLGTRKVLLGHKNGDITSHYSAPQLEERISAANKVCGVESSKTPALTLLKRKAANR